MASPLNASPEPADFTTGTPPGLAALRSWWPLIVVGTLVAVAATYGLFVAFPGRYTATSVVEIDQPAITATGAQGLEATQKLIDLVPTLAARATADDVLTRVKTDVGFPGTIQQIRNEVQAVPVANELAISITSTDIKRAVAQALASATVQEFQTAIRSDATSEGIPPEFQLVITQLTRPDATRPDQHRTRTLGLAAAVAVITLGGIILMVDYLRRAV